jgi:hypothetical protein
MPFGNSKTHSFPSFWITNSFLITISSSFLPLITNVILSVSLFLIQTLSITLELVSLTSDLSFFRIDNPFISISPPFNIFSTSD